MIAGVKASAVLHKAQRQTEENGRIVAELVDYRHAWNAFNQSVASLYGVRVRPEVVAVVDAAAKLGAKRKDPSAAFVPESVKITVGALRKELGINSNDVASARLREAVESGALEQDDSKSGGRGRPRYYWLRQTADQLRDAPTYGVFPAPHSVQKIFFTGREGSENDGQNGQNGWNEQSGRADPTSCPSYPFYPPVLDPSLLSNTHMPQKVRGDTRHTPRKGNGGSSRSPEDLVLAARSSGVVFQLASERDVFTLEWRGPFDHLIHDAIRSNYDAILAVLKREAEPSWT